MEEIIYRTSDSYPGLILSLTLGVVMLALDCRKMLGNFGGAGFGATIAYLTETFNCRFCSRFL